MRTDASRPLVALEISPLAERHFTGIANVTKNLAQELLRDSSVDGRFFFNRSQIPRTLVERLVTMEGGDILSWIVSRADFSMPWPLDRDAPAIGIYPNHKWHRRFFPTEVQIVHDITAIVTPQFHTDEAVEFWQSHIFGDLCSSDLIVAVSESTMIDVQTYFPQLRDVPCIVAPLAPDTEDSAAIDDEVTSEPYVLVLGTLEPRKNVELVFEFLAANRSVLDSHKFVFTGRWGWGESASELTSAYGLDDAVKRGRIVFTGFVWNAVRDKLLKHARCVLYPSQYEGFGLPILEAFSFGVPVITGYGSSLFEVGGPEANYCDVKSIASLSNALRAVLLSPESASSHARARRRMWAGQFRWSQTYRKIRDASLAIARGGLAEPAHA